MSKILVVSKGYVDTEVDDYEQGCTGERGDSWEFDARDIYGSLDELKEAVRKAAYWNIPDDAFGFYDGALRFSIMVDVENTEPTESQLERWRRGEERMWVADGSVALWVVPDDIHGMTDDEAEALGLEVW